MAYLDHQMQNIYTKIFSFSFLIEKGYYDIIPNSKKSGLFFDNYEYEDEYGDNDSINNRIFSLKKFSEYITDKENKNLLDEILKIERDSVPISFSIPKDNMHRRIYKMPNIVNYMQLAHFIIEEKEVFIKAFKQDINSTSRFFNQKDHISYKDTQYLKHKLLENSKYQLHIDLSNFFHTIYTHSIPWIIEGYKKSKLNKNSNNPSMSNKLDSLIENCQSKETYGVPTGNLLTRIIMELYMSYFDELLRNKGLKFHRYVDDFTFGFFNNEDKDSILSVMQKYCENFRLHINDKKTVLNTFPYHSENSKGKIFDFFRNKPISIDIIYEFILLCIDEEKKGNKGSLKCLFAVLENKIKDSSKFCHTIVSENRMGYIPLQHILDISLYDSKLSNRCISLINEIVKKEDKHKVLTIIHQYFDRNINTILSNLSNFKKNKCSQEIYQILLYFIYFNISINIDNIEIIKGFIDEQFDDYIIILSIMILYKNKLDNNELCKILENLFFQFQNNNIYSDDKDEYKYFMRENHWLAKYFVFFISKNIININQYYNSQQYPTYKLGGYKGILNYRYTLRDSDKNSFNKFFKTLLDNNVPLFDLGKNYYFNYL